MSNCQTATASRGLRPSSNVPLPKDKCPTSDDRRPAQCGPSVLWARIGSWPMAHGTHDFEDDPRNERILIWVNGDLVPRARAVVSVFDSGFVLGDGVWEGLRVRAGHPAFLERHL